MEPTLEWLFKLYLLGLICDMIDRKGMIEAVWKSASSGKDAVDLAVLKVLLSEVRSPVVEVQNGSKCDGKIGNNQYEFQMQYGSIGWSVGATLGYAQGAKDKRVIACIGDGSFQVTAQDVSTMIRCGQRSIIFLINNGGYTIEVEIHDGPYNVIKNWDYTALINAIHNGEGKCWTAKVRTEDELTEAIATATGAHKDSLCFIEVFVHKDDTSKELLEWGSRVSAANGRPPNPQ